MKLCFSTRFAYTILNSGCLNTFNTSKIKRLYSHKNKLCIIKSSSRKVDQTINHPECISHCQDISFSYFSKKFKSRFQNKSIVNILPSEKISMRYIFTLKSDANLIYNLGGIACLWFGLSAYSSFIAAFLILSKIKLKLVNRYSPHCQKSEQVKIRHQDLIQTKSF